MPPPASCATSARGVGDPDRPASRRSGPEARDEMGDAVGGPVVALPERLDRPMRLGPFGSGRDALKFVVYAAVGALFVPLVGVLVWLPFLAVGLAVALWRPDGEAIDARTVRYVRWRVRRHQGVRSVTELGAPVQGRGIVRTSGGFVGVLRVGGIPLAYLPPEELAHRFEGFRDALRPLDGRLLLLATRGPIHPTPFAPAEPTPVGPEAAARAGYRELVELIVRRRPVRQVFVALVAAGVGPGAVRQLEAQLTGLADRLRAVGLRPARLRDRSLRDAAGRLGFRGESGGR